MIILFINLLSFILVFNLVLYYLDDFKLSENKYIRFLQILSPLLFVIFIILCYLDISSYFYSILNATNPNNSGKNNL